MKKEQENMNVDRRPIFTIGQVWFDFAKRLPVTRPRYRNEQGSLTAEQIISMQQAQMPPIFWQQQQMGMMGYNPGMWNQNPFGWPY